MYSGRRADAWTIYYFGRCGRWKPWRHGDMVTWWHDFSKNWKGSSMFYYKTLLFSHCSSRLLVCITLWHVVHAVPHPHTCIQNPCHHVAMSPCFSSPCKRFKRWRVWQSYQNTHVAYSGRRADAWTVYFLPLREIETMAIWWHGDMATWLFKELKRILFYSSLLQKLSFSHCNTRVLVCIS